MTNALSAIIRREIAESETGVITFARFMELALYHPRYGYYMTDRPKVGKNGDYYTSASVHPVFAETVGDVIVEMLQVQHGDSLALVEAGGGGGTLMAGVAKRVRETAPQLYERLRLIMIETSPYHRRLQQQALLAETCPVSWYDSLEQAAEAVQVTGVFLSNEWFDAFPVHLLVRKTEGWREIGVGWEEKEGRFVERLLPELSREMACFTAEEKLPDTVGMRIEVNWNMKQAVRDISRLLRSGYVITIDYGDEQEELYHPSRMDGTLMCYFRHRAERNPFVRVGDQDMTAHVNFSALMNWGRETGLEPIAYLRQDQFLLGGGILTKLREHTDRDPFASEAMKQNRAIVQLLSPGGMGGVFRVLVQQKGIPPEAELSCLSRRDPLSSIKKDAL